MIRCGIRPRFEGRMRRIAFFARSPTQGGSRQRRPLPAEEFQFGIFEGYLRRVFDRRGELPCTFIQRYLGRELDEHTRNMVPGNDIQREERGERVFRKTRKVLRRGEIDEAF